MYRVGRSHEKRRECGVNTTWYVHTSTKQVHPYDGLTRAQMKLIKRYKPSKRREYGVNTTWIRMHEYYIGTSIRWTYQSANEADQAVQAFCRASSS